MTPVQTERRKRSDPLLKLLRIVHSTAIIALIAALFITAGSKPSHQSFFDQFHNLRIHYDWNYPRLRYAALCLFIGLFSSSAGLIINARRLRRSKDQLHVTLIVSLVVSIIGLALYFNNILA